MCITNAIGAVILLVAQFKKIRQISRDKYGISRPDTLPPDRKQELARMMHYDYKANPQQIRRMLRVEESEVRALFGK